MSIYPELALYISKNECARTDTVLFSISQVCTRGVTLMKKTKIKQEAKNQQTKIKKETKTKKETNIK